MCPELILWDWNGTLLDDVDLCVDALNRLLAGFGYPQRYDHEQYRAIFGFPIEEYYVRAGFDFTKHSFAELAEKYMEDYVPASAACPLADGAIDALEAFKAAGLRQVILSASNLDTLRRQTDERGVTGYFDESGTPYTTEANRRTAIKKALSMLSAGDTLILCGKGHEDYQALDGMSVYLDERVEVQKFMKSYCKE